jgi:type IV pilus assembly protein PilA
VKRKGFTLIELMVVIAIIIILAAIAIPNYLQMTQRAKKSRIASDMATLATGLETFNTDWGTYPLTAGVLAPVDVAGLFYDEITGTGTLVTNTGTTAAGETAPIEYLKPGTLSSIVDPFTGSVDYSDGHIYYYSTGTTDGSGWVLLAYTGDDGKGNLWLSRTDASSTIIPSASQP